MTSSQVLWVYIVLLVVGGLIGFLKAGSKPSLIASSVFAVALALCQFGKLGPAWVTDLLLGLLLVVFVMRFAKTKKVMPAGLMLVLTAVMLIVRLILA